MSARTLVVVDGPSGAGKSEMLRWAASRYDGVVAISKLTTRPPRAAERAAGWSDLIHVPAAEFGRHLLDYVYRWNGERYGFSRAHLRSALRGARTGLLVVRHEPTLRRLVADLTDPRVVPVRVEADAAVRRERLLADGLEKDEVERRVGEEEPPGPADLYARILVNDGTREEFHRQVGGLIDDLSPG